MVFHGFSFSLDYWTGVFPMNVLELKEEDGDDKKRIEYELNGIIF